MSTPLAPPTAGLRSVALLPEYRSDDHDLIRELYEPCLARSQIYLRAVGYFTSHGISAAARGIEAFVRGTGSMRLVASPHLEPADQDAIRRGYLAREDASERAVLKALAQVEDAALRDRLGYLAWLVYDADGTAFITSHIGPVVYTFGLEDAIRRGILAPFTYYPLEYTLDDNDRERLQNVYAMRRRAKRRASQ